MIYPKNLWIIVFLSFLNFPIWASQDFLASFCTYDMAQPSFADSVCAMLNAVRMNPQEVANSYSHSWFYSDSDPNDRSLLSRLRSMKAISSPLELDSQLTAMALCHAYSAGNEGHVGHDRITTCAEGFDAECINYGLQGAIYVLMELLEDHGVEDLVHRDILLSEEYQRIGAAQAPHLVYRYGTVIDLGR